MISKKKLCFFITLICFLWCVVFIIQMNEYELMKNKIPKRPLIIKPYYEGYTLEEAQKEYQLGNDDKMDI